ncbi:transglutaminase-like cysteine peptidase [Nitratireductor basaltis]|uniref:Transglutaminase n=1 Tax=Nitratireductor basaltis TaxID=472175 RepID=A0A084U663_9HYPH|nr:transglutaminase-like cysteine peptidase [Nitratireductor basaltis]KFB08449.1 Transglutaminase [Nitratireductor basaltis]
MASQRVGFAVAFSLVVSALSAGSAGATAALATGGKTSQPIGHYDFCKSNPRECALRVGKIQPARMTGGLMRKMQQVNSRVNRAVKPLNDIDIYGREEVWTYPVKGVGDCEDFVLEKRRMLNRSGISLGNLLITVVRKRDGEGHAVLTVRTDKGDFILDNLRNDVRLWNQTGYRFLKRQSSEHTGQWVSLRESTNPLVGAVRQ